jgi:hypothetical protein
MKNALMGAAAALLLLGSQAQAADVGVSITIGQPGFYGRIDIGDVGRPAVLYSRPVVIERVVVDRRPEPVYLRVPPGHSRNWKKHCRAYDACGVPVYFVTDKWYDGVYVPYYRERHERREDRREDRRDNGKGRGRD